MEWAFVLKLFRRRCTFVLSLQSDFQFSGFFLRIVIPIVRLGSSIHLRERERERIRLQACHFIDSSSFDLVTLRGNRFQLRCFFVGSFSCIHLCTFFFESSIHLTHVYFASFSTPVSFILESPHMRWLIYLAMKIWHFSDVDGIFYVRASSQSKGRKENMSMLLIATLDFCVVSISGNASSDCRRR